MDFELNNPFNKETKTKQKIAKQHNVFYMFYKMQYNCKIPEMFPSYFDGTKKERKKERNAKGQMSKL